MSIFMIILVTHEDNTDIKTQNSSNFNISQLHSPTKNKMKIKCENLSP